MTHGSPSTLPARLERRRLLDRAWQLYVQDGVESAGLAPEIQQSWRRVRQAYRIDPGIIRCPRLLSPDALEEKRERDDVFRLAQGILEEFAARLGLAKHVLSYFDGDGWMLSIDGHPSVLERVAEINFGPGANWSEESAGTNGPGTALAERKAVEVFASEHFVAAWQPWSCAAAPIFGPGSAAPAGLIDITGPWEVQHRQALLVAKAIARAVQERLRAASNARDEVVRYAFRAAREAGDAIVAVDAQGRVLAANDAAGRRELVRAGSLPVGMSEALVTRFRNRAQGCESEIRLDPPEGPPVLACPVWYEGSAVGAIVRSPAPAGAARPARARSRMGAAARYDFSRILGASEAVRRAIELARLASGNQLPVVLFGESGTGKELFAHAIHSASERRDGPFVPVNCGCIPSELVEAELFGYEAGTFTGGRREGNPGRFEDAHGGTLFLDEVSELSGQAQTALLRVLQEGEVVRLGGSAPRRVDVRVIAATNKPLEEEIRAGRFRRDLYYRLNVFSISVPPLRERSEDVALLAQVFIAQAEAEVGRRGLTLAPEAMAALRAHPWPGNVRELKNVILRAAATAPGAQIRAEDLLLDMGASAPEGRPSASSTRTLRGLVLESERDALLGTLDSCSWNFARAAQQLGISRMTLYRRAQKCGISRTGRPR